MTRICLISFTLWHA